MDGLALPFKFIISLCIGAAIGLERESQEKTETDDKDYSGSMGVRTFALITALGSVAGFLIKDYLFVSIIISVTFMSLLTAYYILSAKYTKDIGLTTEIAVIFAYLIGLLLSLSLVPTHYTIALAVILLLILSRKKNISQIVAGISRPELNAFISYGLLALVILPFLPNQVFRLVDLPYFDLFREYFGPAIQKFGSLEIINPFKLWLVVALITGVDLAGYILERLVGKNKGWLLASMAGGFISSTATTQSLAQESRGSRIVNGLVAAALLANMVSFFQIVILIIPLNFQLFVRAFPVILIWILSAIFLSIYFLSRKDSTSGNEKSVTHKIKDTEIFSLLPAIKFAGFFLLIRLVSQLSLIIFGSSGFIITSALAAISGMDAVVITIAELAGVTINMQTALFALVLANSFNLSAKALYSFLQGDRRFSFQFTSSIILIIVSSVLMLFIV